MQMTHGDGERIRCVERRRRLLQPEQQLDHLLHLVFLGAAVADDGAFHLRRRVFDDGAPGFDGSENGHAARMAKLQRAADVPRVKQRLDGHAVGTIRREERGQLVMNARQTLGKGFVRGRRDGAAGNEVMPAAVRLHAAVAGALGAGIDAEDSHASEASISFSSMSKFAQTCCTSS